MAQNSACCMTRTTYAISPAAVGFLRQCGGLRRQCRFLNVTVGMEHHWSSLRELPKLRSFVTPSFGNFVYGYPSLILDCCSQAASGPFPSIVILEVDVMVQYPLPLWSSNISHSVPPKVSQRVSVNIVYHLSHLAHQALDSAKMRLSKLVPALFWATLTFNGQSNAVPASLTPIIKPYREQALQDLVTWDEHSILVRGERIMLYNGEFHPYRLPVTSLWLDIFQKLKAAGFSGASFYTDWYYSLICKVIVLIGSKGSA